MELRALLKDPRIFAEGRLPAHSDHTVCFAGENEPRMLTLDGNWKFHFCPDLDDRTPDYETNPKISDNWSDIRVPAHINRVGHGVPLYTDTAYPWDGYEQLVPGELPREIPVAQYAKRFTLPEGWEEETLRLRLEGVEPAFRVFCNGKYLGYSEDSFTPSEFDLTGLLKAGENYLAVEVYRWSSGSWLEDQDFWRFWGIFRSVKLLCLPKSHIEDLRVNADMYGGLMAQMRVSGTADWVRARLIDPSGNEAACEETAVENGSALFSMTVVRPVLWSAESPNLYRLELELLENYEPVESCTQTVGFRTVRIENGLLKLNGKRIVFHGVNRHEWNYRHGRVITVAEMEQDARTMKKNNINAVRASHYPNRSEWYEICDRVGLYLIDEANLETHGSWVHRGQRPENQMPLLPDGRPEWRGAVLDRGKSMLERDKNHPSVLIWSCGNESKGGEVIYDLSQMLRSADGTRPVQYEGISNDNRYPDTSDLYSFMYRPVKEMEQRLRVNTDKPTIQVEYAHAMGNSCGSLEDYIHLEETYPQYQGGFIWDWVDQLLEQDGTLCYGGDYREWPNNGDFAADGLLFADRTPSPKLAAVKAAYAPCKFRFVPGGVRVSNGFLFTELSEFVVRLSVHTPQGEYTREDRSIACLPGESVLIPWNPTMPKTGEAWAEVSLLLKKEMPWAEAGYELVFAQKTLRSRAEAESGWRFVDGAEYAGFHSKDLSVLFSRATGRMSSLQVWGIEWMATPMRPAFWRAPVSNDAASNWPFEKGIWKSAEQYHKLESFQVREAGAAWEAEAVWQLPTQPRVSLTTRVRFEAGQRICVESECLLPEGMEPPFVFGSTLATFQENSSVDYDGLGPVETVPDRLSGARRGRWTLDARKALTPYMKPQACGLRCETHSLECGGLRIEANGTFAFSALPWTQSELENAAHPNQLPPSDKVELQLLSDSCGVGGDNTWGARPQPEYCLSKRNYRMSFVITPAL